MNPQEDNSLDLLALKRKYRQERDRRLRRDGEFQYVEASGDFAEFYHHDPFASPSAREPSSGEIDVAILGGGFGGLMAGVNLRNAGVDDFRIIDMGSDFGGTWYWNRYPGIQCDIESYCYMPLLEELSYIPREKYSRGPEIHEHCRHIGEKYGLYEKALFGTRVTSLRWDDDTKRWRVGTNRDDDIRARFLIMALGSYNRLKLPGIPGIRSFKGHSFHTARWDYAYTGGDSNGGLAKLGDKRVAIIGTGSSAVQCIPHLARHSRHLYVFQRTPAAVDFRGNRPTDPEWARTLPTGWQRARQKNFDDVTRGVPVEEDLVCDGWTEVGRTIIALTKDGQNPTPKQIAAALEREDFRRMARLRDRVDEVVERKDVAEALKPWYRQMCKRATFSDDYLPTFNRDNVTLVDVASAKGVERITEDGVLANGTEYAVDCIIFASGFEVTSEIGRRLGIAAIEGRGGKSLYEHWKDGFKTLHGFTTRGFPNQFFTGYTQGAISGNMGYLLQEQTRHIAYIIREAIARGAASVEPTERAQDAWVETVHAMAAADREQWLECTPGIYNNEGGEIMRSYLGDVYTPGLDAFSALLEGWRDKGNLEGIELGY